MKKILPVFLMAFLAFAFIACGGSGSAGFKPGTYEGTARGFHGDITMSVTVDAEKITDIQAVSHNETAGISDPAFERIPRAILRGQTLAVDTVAGASYSSGGIIAAVTAALEKAGGDIKTLQTKAPAGASGERELKDYTADVIVIGGGGAGLAAATTANQAGARVIIIEKLAQVGGNTMISGAAYNAVDPLRQIPMGIKDSLELHYTQTFEGGDELGNPALVMTLVEGALPALKWMESLGMEFTNEVFTVLGGLWPRAHKPVKPLGTGYIETQKAYLESHSDSMMLLTEVEATELVVTNGRVTGVLAKGADKDYELFANKAVIIATGGFGGNPEMREEYNKHWASLANLKTTNSPGATGDGIRMAQAVGANVVGMEWIQLLPMGDPETGSLSGNIEQNVENRIFVNKNGNRFVDEGARRDVMTTALFAQPDAYMWVILDKHAYPTPDKKNNFNESIEELIAQGRAFGADTLDDLARQIGVPASNLKAAVDGFNAAVDRNRNITDSNRKIPDAFGRTLFQDRIDTPPFYAGARVPTVHHTMGGLEINTKAQVIDKSGSVIPGLYAAGEVTGGIHGSNRLGGNALADIHVFGRIAGQNAVRE